MRGYPSAGSDHLANGIQDDALEGHALRARRRAVFLELSVVRAVPANLGLLRTRPLRDPRCVAAPCLAARMALRVRHERGRLLLGRSFDLGVRRPPASDRGARLCAAVSLPGILDGARRDARAHWPGAA